ncbi:type III PLP-dependent enzyme [Shumkonia mesophila]|uniref:type III PLP-dependent enzyme n=1 Tax=Shumkonia mesophila TaxID=2838854 RepID=UPI0029343A8F|nr:type III PLP-dependent enzyme [Shumkonia mesophila]
MTPKIAHFLKESRPATPCLVIDLDVVNERYRRLQDSLPGVVISYAVKANPARPVLEILNAGGSHFDAASIYEIEDLLALGVTPDRIVYGNTIKKEGDIAAAYAHGVRLYAFDSEAEVEKLARSAPGAGVYCRIITTCEGADWPLSRKFGCELDMAGDLLLKARDLGLDAQGLSFHVGSQQTNPRQWGHAIKRAAQVFRTVAEQGLQLRMLNLGGGFPVRYRKEVPEIEEVAGAIMEAMRREFGNALPRMFIEPGRIITADAGIIETEVVLISTKNYANGVRWVYLDVGKFGGLAETMDEAIQYPLVTHYNGAPSGPVVIAGPTCDGADILYEKADYSLPLDLKVGDKIQIGGAGAYTTTYASICFNGFPPLQAHYI